MKQFHITPPPHIPPPIKISLNSFLLAALLLIGFIVPNITQAQQTAEWCVKFRGNDINYLHDPFYSETDLGPNVLNICEETEVELFADAGPCFMPSEYSEEYQYVYLLTSSPNAPIPAEGTIIPQSGGPWSTIINTPWLNFNSANFNPNSPYQFNYTFSVPGTYALIGMVGEYDGSGNFRVANIVPANPPGERSVHTGKVYINYLSEAGGVAITGVTNLCNEEGNAIYAISSSLAGYTINWTVQNGTIVSGQGTDEIEVQWNSTNTSGIVSVVVDNGVCQAVGELNVFGCCIVEPEVSLLIVDQSLSETILGSYSSLDNSNTLGIVYLAINGTFKIDQNFDFSNIGFTMGPMSKIIFGDGVIVNFINCDFFAVCDYMSDGIYLNTSATVTFEGGQLDRSINGIVSDFGAAADIRDVSFSWNYHSIQIRDDNPATIFQYSNTPKLNISGCEFISANLILAPYANSKAMSAIFVSNVANAQIGNITENGNIFGTLNPSSSADLFLNQIVSTNSKLVVENSNFYKSTGTNNTAAIYAEAINRLRWQDWEMGLTVDGSAIRNHFDGNQRGIYTRSLDNVTIWYNDFDRTNRSIHLENTYNYSIVRYNEINKDLTTFTDPTMSLVGIYATQTQPRSLSNSFTYNTVEGCMNGILVVNQNGSNVSVNNIIVRSEPNVVQMDYRSGIRMENCHNATLQLNNLDHTPNFVNTDNTADKLRGITLSLCMNNYLIDNRVKRFGTGIYGAADLTSTQFRCNYLEMNRYGFYFLDAALSNQGSSGQPSDNRWVSGAGPYRVAGNPLLTNSNWYYRTGTMYNPNPTSPSLSFLNSFQTSGQFACQYVPPTDSDYTPGYEDEYREMAMGGIVDGSQQVANADYAYFEDNYAYRTLKDAENLIQINHPRDQVFNQFYTAKANSNIGLIKNYYDQLSAKNPDSAGAILATLNPVHAQEGFLQQVNQVYLATWAKGVHAFDSAQYATLYGIALLNPFSAGEAVYTARVMLGLDILQMGGQYRRAKEFAEDASSKLHLYPNPVQDILQISAEVLTENDQASIELFDIMGKSVLKEQLSYSEGSWKLDVKQLTAGVYYVRFTLNNSHTLTNKLVKY